MTNNTKKNIVIIILTILLTVSIVFAFQQQNETKIISLESAKVSKENIILRDSLRNVILKNNQYVKIKVDSIRNLNNSQLKHFILSK